MPEPQLIHCPACGATNRVPPEKLRAGLAAVCGRCKRPLPTDDRPLAVTDATFAEVVERSLLPVLLDVWAPWCGPCRYLEPVIRELAAELAGRVRIAKLNADENPATSARFQIRSLPSLLLLHAGRELDRMIGAQPKAEILRRVQRALASEPFASGPSGP